MSSVARSWEEPELTFAVNAAAVENLVAALLDAAGTAPATQPRFFQASSAEVSGGAADSPYARAKAAAEEVVREARDGDGLHAVVRPCSTTTRARSGRRAFVTRKITRAVAEIAAGQRDELRLGNLDVQPRLGLRRRLRRRDAR